MRPRVGTIEWGRQTSGRLSLGDKISQLAQATLFQIRVLPAELRWRLGLSGPGVARLDERALAPPNSEIARAAESLIQTVHSAALVNHCLRTFLWGRALALASDVHHDAELFYLASLLHDLGLAQDNAGAWPGSCCFALDGSAAARRFAEEQGMMDSRREALAAAIAMHLNVRVGIHEGPEAHLLNAGAALDVAGLRFWELAPDDVNAVLHRHPRLGMKSEIAELWGREAEHKPGCRAHFLDRWLWFRRRIASAPFPE